MRIAWRVLIGLLVAGSALAQSGSQDVGLVNLLLGDVEYVPRIGAAGKVQSYMRVREGDRFNVPAGAVVRVVYFDSARQERWNGPSSFRAGRAQGEPVAGTAAEVASLPAGVPKRIARVPELLQNAKLGGIQVRSAAPRTGPRTPEEQKVVAEARATYAQMRGQAPSDDIAPEMFLYAALAEFSLYPEMREIVDEMKRRQPVNEEVKSLDAWLETRLRR
jgi:hypothetical protein